MDLAIGLGAVGLYMGLNSEYECQNNPNNIGNLTNKNNNNQIPQLIKREPINGNDIYNNAKYKDYKSYADSLAYRDWELSKHPMETGVIPNNYNQMKDTAKRVELYHAEDLAKIKARNQYLESIKETNPVEGFGSQTKNFFKNINKKTIIMIILTILILFLFI